MVESVVEAAVGMGSGGGANNAPGGLKESAHLVSIDLQPNLRKREIALVNLTTCVCFLSLRHYTTGPGMAGAGARGAKVRRCKLNTSELTDPVLKALGF